MKKLLNTKEKKTEAIIFLLILIISAVLLVSDLVGWSESKTAGDEQSLTTEYTLSSQEQSELEALARADSRVMRVIEEPQLYSPELINLLLTQPEARSFVLGYPDRDTSDQSGELTSEELEGGIPELIQWDARWGYIEYGTGPLGITGCGPTCLSMVMTALTGDPKYTPGYLAEFSLENNYYLNGSGSPWALFTDGAPKLGISCQSVPVVEASMVSALEEGKVLVANVHAGIFTDAGHYLVISGYADGLFEVKDPNSPSNSARGWSLAELEGQMDALWAFSPEEQ